MNVKLRKIVIRMSKLAIYSVVICQSLLMVLASESNAQRKYLKEIYVELAFEESTVDLKELIESIEVSSQFHFAYSRRDVRNKEIQITSGKWDLRNLMNEISTQGQFSIRRINETITLMKVENEVLPQVNEQRDLQTSVTGKITDENGEPLPGATIQEKGTSNGTITDVEGNYSLTVPENAELTISFVGFETIEVPLNGRSVLDVQLQADISALEEVVVVGYGTQKKSDLTGSVATISPDRIDAKPNTNFAQALQGSIPGVNIVTNSSGAEQNDVSILIRGRNSINASNSPLIVLDGVPYTGSISDINTSDVKSITVLKDASATAIYGSRGANGVILIESKKGKTGAPKISYNGYMGVTKIANLPEIYDGPGFGEFKEEREPGELTAFEQSRLDAGEYTDWVGLATQNGIKQEHTLSVSGANERANYYVSAGILDAKGITINDKFQRASLRVNLGFNISENLKFGTSTQLTRIDRSGLNPDFGGDQGIYFQNPLGQAYDDDGNLSIFPWPDDQYFRNPLGNTLAINDDFNNKLFTNNYLEYSFPFLDGLSFKLNTGVEYGVRSQRTYRGRNMAQGLTTNGTADIDDDTSENYLLENILNYNKSFGQHTVGITALYSAQRTKFFSNDINGSGFSGDLLTYHQVNLATNLSASTNFNQTSLISQMGRLNYNYAGKYILTFTMRRDGYSGFGDDSKYGVFPSVALGWNLSDEGFFPEGPLSSAKLRVSYGKNGNQAVGPYDNLARLSPRPYVDGSATAPGYVPSQLANNELGWETTATFNIGADFGLINDRVQVSVDAYKAYTSDLLLNRLIPSVHGITSITQNVGETQNVGLEFILSGYAVNRGDFTWHIAGNASFNKNEIVSLFGKDEDDIGNQLFIGKPIRVNYSYQFDGIWQEGEDATTSAQPSAEPGDVKVNDIANTSLDTEDNPIIQITAEDDRVIQGQRDPKAIWGLQNTFQYKGFKLYVFIHGVSGITKRNSLKSLDVHNGVRKNWFVTEFWTPENPINDFPRNHPDANQYGVSFFESADFVRIKDVTLSYDFNNGWFGKTGFSNVRVYATTRNLFTITKWEGMDPELNDQADIPLQREFVFGLNFSL